MVYTVFAIGLILLLEDNLMDVINNPPPISCYLQYCYICKCVLNIDIINGKTLIGNGWYEYKIKDIVISKDTDITPHGKNDDFFGKYFFGKSLKNIIIFYSGKEDNTTDTASKIVFTGKDNNGNTLAPVVQIYDIAAKDGGIQSTSNGDTLPNSVITDLSTYTAWFDDPGSYNYQIYALPLQYPITLKELNIKLTCPGTSASIINGTVVFVFE